MAAAVYSALLHNYMAIRDREMINTTSEEEEGKRKQESKRKKEKASEKNRLNTSCSDDLSEGTGSNCSSGNTTSFANHFLSEDGAIYDDADGSSFMSNGIRISKKPISEDLKDPKYFERRRRNNLAAKKSRDARKMREDQVVTRVSQLEQENAILRAQVAMMREEAHILQICQNQKRQNNANLPNISFAPPTASFQPSSENVDSYLPLPFSVPSLSMPMNLPLHQNPLYQLQLPMNFLLGRTLDSPIAAEQSDVQIPLTQSLHISKEK